MATRINNNLTSSRLYSTRSQDLPLCDSIRNIATVATTNNNNNSSMERVTNLPIQPSPITTAPVVAMPGEKTGLKKSGSVVRFSSSNGNVDDLLLLNNNANVANHNVNDNSPATPVNYPTHHTIIVPAPSDVRRRSNRNLDSSDDDIDEDMTEEEKIRRQNSFPSLLVPRSLRNRKPPFTIEGAMNAIKRKRGRKKDRNGDEDDDENENDEAAAAAGDAANTNSRTEENNVPDDGDDGDEADDSPGRDKRKDDHLGVGVGGGHKEIKRNSRFGQLFRRNGGSKTVKSTSESSEKSPEDEPMLLSANRPPLVDNNGDYARRKQLSDEIQQQQQQQQQQVRLERMRNKNADSKKVALAALG